MRRQRAEYAPLHAKHAGNSRSVSRGGRPQHVPTDASRAHVAKLIGFGITIKDICALMKLDDDTLRKHYRYELETGGTTTNVNVISALYNSAVNRNSVPAQIYWTKARAGWRDSVDVNVHGSEPTALHLLAAQLISERLATERGDTTPVIEGAVVDDDATPKE